MSKTKDFNINDVPEVSCLNCQHKTNDNGLISFCNKIKMPQPSKELKRCLLKSKL